MAKYLDCYETSPEIFSGLEKTLDKDFEVGMVNPAPRPWSLDETNIVDANGITIATIVNLKPFVARQAVAKFIVDTVNAIKP